MLNQLSDCFSVHFSAASQVEAASTNKLYIPDVGLCMSSTFVLGEKLLTAWGYYSWWDIFFSFYLHALYHTAWSDAGIPLKKLVQLHLIWARQRTLPGPHTVIYHFKILQPQGLCFVVGFYVGPFVTPMSHDDHDVLKTIDVPMTAFQCFLNLHISPEGRQS